MSMMTLIDSASRRAWLRLAIGALAMTALAACDEDTPVEPGAAPSVTAQRSKFEPNDASPHHEGRVNARGVSLHFLDWGGKGPPLVLLAGRGDNAHIYDDLAAKLANQYHVIAITRRGFGQSSHPSTGYAVDTLVNDIVAVLDHLHLDRVYIAGHSIAGNELTRLAVRYPERVARVVYIDAAADRTAGIAARAANTVEIEDLLNPPPPEAADLESFGALVSYQKRITKGAWTRAREINLWYAVTVDKQGRVTGFSTDDAIDALFNAESRVYRPEFKSLEMPTLAIGALPGTIFDVMPWLPADVSGDSLVLANIIQGAIRNQIQNNVTSFGMEAPHSSTMFVDNTTHYVFIVNESTIESALRGFLPAAMSTYPKPSIAATTQ